MIEKKRAKKLFSAKIIKPLIDITLINILSSIKILSSEDLICILNPLLGSGLQFSINKKKKEVYDLIDQLHISTFENNTGKPNVEVFEDRVNAIVQNAAGEALSLIHI